MAVASNGKLRERVNFSKILTSIQIPNLIEVQKKSYERFLQMNLLPGEREDIGLQAVFNSVFPISDFRGVSSLGVRGFLDWQLGVQVRQPERPVTFAQQLPFLRKRDHHEPLLH